MKFCKACRLWIDSKDTEKHLSTKEHKKNSTQGLSNIIFHK